MGSAPSHDLVVKGGLVVTPTGTLRADVGIAGERIAAIGLELDGARELDAEGLYVIPGAIDGHVHLADPTFPPYAITTADTFATGTRAAAFGGTTTVVDFAQPAVGQPLMEELERRRGDAEGEAVIDYALHMNVRDPDPLRVREIAAVVAAGVPSFKLYMAYDGYRIPDAAILRAMTALAAEGGLAVLHAENDDVIAVETERLAAEGRGGPAWLAATCPPAAEAEAVHRAIMLAEVAHARLLVFHLSCREAARELAWAKRRGRSVSGEVTSHGLTIEASELRGGDARAQSLAVRPPLRDGAQRAALWAALADGTIDVVGSDHCPRTPLADSQPAGVSGIEPRLALVHTFGVGAGLIDLRRWVEVCCARPAAILGLDRKGRLEPGADADVVLFDPRREVVLSAATLHSALPFSSYEGVALRGWPATTISRGEVIVADGDFIGDAGPRSLRRAGLLMALRVDAAGLRADLETLRTIGATPEGGIDRRSFGDAHLRARAWFIDRAERAGLRTRVDAAGNHSAVLGGGERTLMLGSHLDSVPNGGNFDGALGVVAALHVLIAARAAALAPPLALEAIDFTDEDGTLVGLLGSWALAGALTREVLATPRGGREALLAGLARGGLTEDGLFEARRDPATIAGYLELPHRAGAGARARRCADRGREAIFGSRSFALEFRGAADHAGTTPMGERRDAGARGGGLHGRGERPRRARVPGRGRDRRRPAPAPGRLQRDPRAGRGQARVPRRRCGHARPARGGAARLRRPRGGGAGGRGRDRAGGPLGADAARRRRHRRDRAAPPGGSGCGRCGSPPAPATTPRRSPPSRRRGWCSCPRSAGSATIRAS